MQHPVHAISSAPREWKAEHLVGIGFVAVLHVIAVGAIVSGLVPKIVEHIVPPITIVDVPKNKDPIVARIKPDEPQPVKLPQYREPVVVEPVIDIARTDPGPQRLPGTADVKPPEQVALLAPDTAVSAVAGTHTTPPYPGLERRLGNQGTVELRLTISPQGAVTSADVVRSSGFPGLDQAAVSWVLQHWKYKPAVQGGAPVASTTVAAVVFNLRSGG